MHQAKRPSPGGVLGLLGLLHLLQQPYEELGALVRVQAEEERREEVVLPTTTHRTHASGHQASLTSGQLHPSFFAIYVSRV